MGKVNIWLKRSYTGVISVIAGISILLLGFTLFAHGSLLHNEELENMVSGIHFMYIFTSITLLTTIVGGFGIWKEKKWALIVFAVAMILSSLYLIANKIAILVLQPQLKMILEDHYKDMFPLDNANETEIAFLNRVQIDLQCCGVNSYKDWENKIPKSCLCGEDSVNQCVTAPRDSDVFIEGQIVMIYAEPCLPMIIANDLKILHVMLGILLGFILFWVLSVALCIAILCQLNKKLETPKVVYSSEAKAGNYTSLTETPDTEIT